ncbi:uncharacterized protein ACBT57_007263 [Dama dama]
MEGKQTLARLGRSGGRGWGRGAGGTLRSGGPGPRRRRALRSGRRPLGSTAEVLGRPVKEEESDAVKIRQPVVYCQAGTSAESNEKKMLLTRNSTLGSWLIVVYIPSSLLLKRTGKQKLMLSLRMNTMTTTHSGPLSLPSVDPDIYH